MSDTVTIYALRDPRDDRVYYIGKSNKAARRLIEHRNEHGRTNPEKTKWIAELQSQGLDPVMQVLEETDKEHEADREQFWIRHGRQQGWPLVNKAHGYETTQRKIDSVLEQAIHLGLAPTWALTSNEPMKQAQLVTATARAQIALKKAYEQEEAARKLAATLENLLERAQEAAREIEPVNNGPDRS